mmetsp:Transcript_25313/g.55298  ORF Transcript_25313/g.55298 Transcript_25313/m.55298 type:complete len:405 (-) Transcript_25313:30-1244(-)
MADQSDRQCLSLAPVRTWPIKTAALLCIVLTVIALLPATKQSLFSSGSQLHPSDEKGVKVRSKVDHFLVSEGDSPETHDVCPRLSEVVYCPSNPDANAQRLYCRDCIDEPLQDTYRINATVAQSVDQPEHKIYMPILTPPFFGSSVLSNVLSSSPSVTNMCKDPYHRGRIPWQCESTPMLVNEGIIKKKARWDPMATNWSEAYGAYERLRVWSDMNAPIRLDKAPPNIAKAKQLVEYFESQGLDYRFVVMMRHPCRKDWKHPDHETERYSNYLWDVVDYVPAERRFMINYDDLVTRPGAVVRSLLDWLPLLSSLSINSNELKPKQPNLLRQWQGTIKPKRPNELRRREGTNATRRLQGAKDGGRLRSYVESDKCRLALRSDSNTTPAGEIVLWNKLFANDRLPY